MVTSHRSFCRFCEAACGIVVDVERAAGETEVLRVRGDAEHPLSHGYTCSKGRNLPAWHHHPQRLDVPCVRQGGVLGEVGWDDALDDLAARIGTLLEEHGPDSVGVLLATGSAFDAAGRRTAERLWQQLASRSKYTSATIDTPCKPFVSRLMSGFSGLVPTIDPATAGLTLLLGINPVVSHGHLNGMPDPVVTLRSLAADGRELWVVDPRSTETARLATRHVAPRPGTDHLLLAHVVRELLVDGADRDYLAVHASAADVATLERVVAPCTASWVAQRCDVPVTDLGDLVAAVRRHGRVSAQTGTGTTMAGAANLTEWMVWALHVVTGSFDRPGGMWFNPGFLRQLDRRNLAPAGDEPGPGPRARPELHDWLGELPCAALVDEIEAGNLRALIVFGGNPMRALPEPARVGAALAALDVLAVVDVVETDTTALATHVLPSAGQLERADLPLTIDQFVITLSTQYTPAVVAPGALRRPAWWIFAALAERLGLSVLPAGETSATCDDDTILRTVGERGRGDYDTLLERRVAVADPVYGWVLERVLPGGRWRLAPHQLVEQFVAQLDDEPPPLSLVPRRQARHLNSQLVTGIERVDEPAVLLSSADASRRGIADGDAVEVASRHGSVRGVARVSGDVRDGVVSVPHGFGDPNVSSLTSSRDGVDPYTGMVRQSGVGVTVARLS